MTDLYRRLYFNFKNSIIMKNVNCSRMCHNYGYCYNCNNGHECNGFIPNDGDDEDDDDYIAIEMSTY